MSEQGANQLLKGVLLVIFAEAVLVATGVLIRTVAEALSVAQLVFLRNAFGLLIMLPLVLGAKGISLKTSRINLHLGRALVGVSAMSCLYYGWTHLPLGTAALLKQTAPLFMPLLALWFLKEKIHPILFWSLPIGFIGVALVLNPANAGLQLAVLIGLAGALLGAQAKIFVRKMKDTEPSRRVVFYFSLFASLFSAPFALQGWVALGWFELAGVIGIAALSTLAQLSMTKAYHSAPAGYLGPFTYSSVIIASLVGWLLWDETLATLTIAGMGLIVLGGVMTLKAKA
ncbi:MULTISPECIES: DMT family transporter [unclassified Marinobacterium]|uniref:DMT family transporter n=1 Tax=unclassified Marinobacterium TaxID=2644139 RepID=UPI001568FA97|nr:EamA-like transporter family protein [Marinobacterium sp. xm-d-420]NRP47859.1 EamA-like transporter family protein [Marinobacterium sp. xm-d-543]NRQ24098.1 EamA-like transporter family protein [Marinobacterium sp. xm-m-312]